MSPQTERLPDKFEDIERAVERDLHRPQRRLKQSIPSYVLESRRLTCCRRPSSIPWSCLALLGVSMSFYQWICLR